MECTLYKKQYVGKAEKPFDRRLNNPINDVKIPHPKRILACKRFQEKNNDSNNNSNNNI